MNLTQKQRVINRINEVGYVDNFWAIDNFILRLGAIILDLKKDGWVFETHYGINKNKKNYHYIPTLRPSNQKVKCCYSYERFGIHTRDCVVREQMEAHAKVLEQQTQYELALIKKDIHR